MKVYMCIETKRWQQCRGGVEAPQDAVIKSTVHYGALEERERLLFVISLQFI